MFFIIPVFNVQQRLNSLFQVFRIAKFQLLISPVANLNNSVALSICTCHGDCMDESCDNSLEQDANYLVPRIRMHDLCTVLHTFAITPR